MFFRWQANGLDPFIDQPGVLPCAEVGTAGQSAWKQEVLKRAAANIQPSGQNLSRRLSNIKLDRPTSLLLYDSCAPPDCTSSRNVTDTDLHEITAAKL